MSLKELNESRQRLVVQAREALDEITKNTDEARAAELDTRHDAIMAEFDATEAKIAREERLAEAEARLAKAADEERAKKRPKGEDTQARGQDEGKKKEYRDVFHKFLQTGGSFDSLDAEERAMIEEVRIQTTTGGAGAAGGYTIPTELSSQIIRAMAAWGPMYSEDVTTVLNTSSGNPIVLPTIDDTASTAEPGTEGTQLTDDGGKDAVFGKKELGAYDYNTEWLRFSWQLAQDSVLNVEALLADLLGERLGRIANAKLTVGNGATEPNGIVTAAPVGKTAAAIAAITYDEVIDLIHSVDPAYRSAPKVQFMFNDLTLAAIRKLKDLDGKYLWTAGDVQGGVPSTIFGYRYRINQAVPGIATGAKALLFGDFGKYFTRKVGSPTIGVVRERFWPDIGIAGYVRFDGELGDPRAIKALALA